ncbi:hypothetical protein FGO68_gene1399 [Halteria grandinella]|uniref:GOLD domain-containing protein n=1 Tax=Halteria grandinella TaxID=5974 RepID=A0A8J8NN49_HALGN|nr:hypothetical protein FGO68_gene1399 [Halteria grandinella]
MHALLIASTIFAVSSALSIKVYDTNEYCFTVYGPEGQFLHFTYLVRGRNEDNVKFTIKRESGQTTTQLRQRELDVVERFDESGKLTACMQSHDEYTKTFNFFFEVKQDSKPKKGITLTHIQEATEKLNNMQALFDKISRNIYLKNDFDKELTQRSIDSKQTQKWLSIIKMLLVLLISAAQVYFVTLFFTTGSKKLQQNQGKRGAAFSGI